MYPIIDIIKMMHSVRRRKILDIMIQFYNQYNFATVKASKYMYFKYETEVHEFLFFLTQKQKTTTSQQAHYVCSSHVVHF